MGFGNVQTNNDSHWRQRRLKRSEARGANLANSGLARFPQLSEAELQKIHLRFSKKLPATTKITFNDYHPTTQIHLSKNSQPPSQSRINSEPPELSL